MVAQLIGVVDDDGATSVPPVMMAPVILVFAVSQPGQREFEWESVCMCMLSSRCYSLKRVTG